MKQSRPNPTTWLLILACTVCPLLLVASLPSIVQAAPSALPPRPVPQDDSHHRAKRIGGFIELEVHFGEAWPAADVPWQELWTVVQWQDPWGYWHDVEGWQGTLDSVDGFEGWKVWWLSADLFGKGPFRWLIYRSHGGWLMAVSDSFVLPQRVGETVTVEVPLTP